MTIRKVTTLQNTGLLTISNNTASVPVYFIKDTTTEGTQTFTFKILRSDEYRLSSNLESTVTVYDTSIDKTFTLTTVPASPANVNEGEVYYINVYTTGVEDGVNMHWLIDNVDAADISTPLSGYVTIQDGYANVRVATIRDRNTEGPEIAVFRLLANTDDCVELSNDLYANVTLLDTSIDPTYNLFSNVNVVDEGNCVMFQLETTGLDNGIVLNYEIDGISRSDLFFGSLIGKITHRSFDSGSTGNANVVLGIAKDRITEGLETIVFRLVPDTTIKLNDYLYANVIIHDNSRSRSFVLTSNVSQVPEGQAVNFNLYTEQVPHGTVFDYVVTGVSGSDIVGGSAGFTGTVTLTSSDSGATGNANKSFSVVADSITEGLETIHFKILANSSISLDTNLFANVDILDTSRGPSIDVFPNRASVPENGSVIFTITSTGIPNGSTMQYTITDFADANNHVSGATTYTTSAGSFVINALGMSQVIVNMKEDHCTDGTEFLYINIAANTTLNTPGITGSVTIQDTSISPNIELSLSDNPVIEGNNLVVTITGNRLNAGQIVYWSHNVPQDMTPASGFVIMDAISGSVTGNTVSLSVVSGDGGAPGYTEEYIFTTSANNSICLHAASITGTIAEQAVPEIPLPSYTVTPSSNTVNEGEYLTFTIGATNVADGTVLYWSIDGSATAPSDVGLGTGTVSLASGQASVSFYIKPDLTTEGTENIRLNIKESSTGPVVASSSYVNILDTSTAPTTPTYNIVPNLTSVNEGSSVQFTVTTTNVANGTTLYWYNTGTTASGDFDPGVTSGSFTINNNLGYITLNVKADLITEGSESIILRVRTTPTGTAVATATTVTVSDTSTTPVVVVTTPTYQVIPRATTVNEGTSIIYDVYTTNVPNGTNLYWTNAGTATGTDISSGTNNGQLVISSGAATVTLAVLNDSLTEGDESHVFQLRTNSVSGTVVATATTVIIKDTSLAPVVPTSYSISTNTVNINEGQTLTVNIVTSNVPNGTVLNWTLSGIAEAADFSGGTVSGSVTINNNAASFTLPIVSDAVTEGSETFNILLRNPTTNAILATSATITIADTSLSPAATYSIAASTTSINEDETVTYTITTTNVANGTTLYWRNTGTSNAADFTSGVNSGEIQISNGTGSLVLRAAADKLSESTETIVVQLHGNSTYSDLKATAATVNITNTSSPLSSWMVSIYPPETPVADRKIVYYNEGDTVTFYVVAPDVYSGNGASYPEEVRNSSMYWSLVTATSGRAGASDLLEGLGGSDNPLAQFTLVNGRGTFTITTLQDLKTEYLSGDVYPDSELIYLYARSLNGTIRGTSSTYARIKDTSKTSTTKSTASATATITNGAVTGTNIVSGGAGYTSTPTITFSVPSTYGATATSTISGGAVSGTSIVNGGSGYTTAPTITFSSPASGTTATGTGIITNGRLTGINITNPGSGYTTAPSVTVSAPTGTVSAATGTAVMTGDKLTGINITGAGSGYTEPPTITITSPDSSALATYAASASAYSVNEGTPVTVTVSTTNVPDGTTLYWTNGGNTNASDFAGGVNNGSFVVNNGVGSFTINPLADQSTDGGTETIIPQIRTTPTGAPVASTAPITVVDSSKEPIIIQPPAPDPNAATYTITPNLASVNEGNSVDLVVNGTGVVFGSTGRVFKITATGAGITPGDLFINSLDIAQLTKTSVPFTVSGIGFTQDQIAEGLETVTFKLYTWLNGQSTSTSSVAQTNVNIIDRTTAYTLTATPSVTNEGTIVDVVIDGTNVDFGPTGRNFRVVGSGTNITTSDITAGVLQTAIITLTSLPFTFQIGFTNDQLTEGDELLLMNLRTWLNGDTESTNSVAYDDVLIKDTSVTPEPTPPVITTPPNFGERQQDGALYCPLTISDSVIQGFTGVTSVSNGLATITGSLSGSSIWGNNEFGYSTDSDLRRAAVHAGLLTAGQTGQIRIISLGSKTGFPSTASNGITSSSYASDWCAIYLESGSGTVVSTNTSYDFCFNNTYNVHTPGFGASYTFKLIVKYPVTGPVPTIQNFSFDSGQYFAQDTYPGVCFVVIGDYHSATVLYVSGVEWNLENSIPLFTQNGPLSSSYTGALAEISPAHNLLLTFQDQTGA